MQLSMVSHPPPVTIITANGGKSRLMQVIIMRYERPRIMFVVFSRAMSICY